MNDNVKEKASMKPKKMEKSTGRKHSKTWEAAMRLKGSLIVNDPTFLL